MDRTESKNSDNQDKGANQQKSISNEDRIDCSMEDRKKKAYELVKVEEWLYYIDQFNSLRMYFVIGDTMAMLIDTGYGLMDYRPLLRSITDKPVIVVNTHGDIDHVTGNYLFKDVYISVHDFRDLPVCDNNDLRDKMYSQYPSSYRMEGCLSLDEWKAHSVMDTRYHLIDDGYLFDLGGRTIEVISVPGHTAGSVAYLEKKSGYLFSGDMIHSTKEMNCIILMDFGDRLCDPIHVSLYSFKKLQRHIGEITKIFPCHTEEPQNPNIINNAVMMLENALCNQYNDPIIPNFIGLPSRIYVDAQHAAAVNYVDHAVHPFPADVVVFDF